MRRRRRRHGAGCARRLQRAVMVACPGRDPIWHTGYRNRIAGVLVQAGTPWSRGEVDVMDTDHCPKCNSKAVVAGHFPAMTGWGNKSFEPTGTRFYFHLWKQGVTCPEPFRACLACGLVWTHLRPEDLR